MGPLNIIKSLFYTRTACTSTCLYNALSLRTVDVGEEKRKP